MMFKHLWVAAALTAMAGFAHAVPVTITQTFDEVKIDDYGIAEGLTYRKQHTGTWIFKATIDTDAPNVYPWPDHGSYYTATVTLTQARLGLRDEVVTNLRYLFVHANMLGFTSDPTGGPTWTRTGYNGLSMGTGNFPLAVGAVLHSTDRAWNTFGPQWDGFQFANGARIHGWGYNALSTVRVTAPNAEPDPIDVPEPGSALLLAGALAAMTAARRRSRKAA